MDYKKLLDKYWDGNTSLEEEKELNTYFNGPDVANELVQYKSLFRYYEVQKKQELSSPVLELIDGQINKIVPNQKSFFVRNWLRIAATILVLIVLGFGYQKINEPTKKQRIANYWKSKEINDPQEAYRRTKAALFLVSTKLNKGTETALNQVVKVKELGQYIK